MSNIVRTQHSKQRLKRRAPSEFLLDPICTLVDSGRKTTIADVFEPICKIQGLGYRHVGSVRVRLGDLIYHNVNQSLTVGHSVAIRAIGAVRMVGVVCHDL